MENICVGILAADVVLVLGNIPVELLLLQSLENIKVQSLNLTSATHYFPNPWDK